MCCCIQAKSGSSASLVPLAAPLLTPEALLQREALRHSISRRAQPVAANGTSRIDTHGAPNGRAQLGEGRALAGGDLGDAIARPSDRASSAGGRRRPAPTSTDLYDPGAAPRRWTACARAPAARVPWAWPLDREEALVSAQVVTLCGTLYTTLSLISRWPCV